jgi:uncharacterized protein with GYD domain
VDGWKNWGGERTLMPVQAATGSGNTGVSQNRLAGPEIVEVAMCRGPLIDRVADAKHPPRDLHVFSGRGCWRGGHMSKYLVQVGYTAEAWTAMSRGPQSVMERVQASAEALGGSIESLFFCFGDYDLVGVVEFPDSRGVAAWSMAVTSGGGVRACRTTTLLSVEEGLQALGRASHLSRTR